MITTESRPARVNTRTEISHQEGFRLIFILGHAYQSTLSSQSAAIESKVLGSCVESVRQSDSHFGSDCHFAHSLQMSQVLFVAVSNSTGISMDARDIFHLSSFIFLLSSFFFLLSSFIFLPSSLFLLPTHLPPHLPHPQRVLFHDGAFTQNSSATAKLLQQFPL